jgi:CheY-like chemotaxis protein
MSNVCEMRASRLDTAGRRQAPPCGGILVGGAAMGATLARCGQHARIERDAEGLLDALEQRSFDLVLLDLRAPEIDAITTVKLYRWVALGEPQPPIVAVAEPGRPEDMTECRDAGIETCVELADAVRAMADLSTRGVMTRPPRGPAGVTRRYDQVPVRRRAPGRRIGGSQPG